MDGSRAGPETNVDVHPPPGLPARIGRRGAAPTREWWLGSLVEAVRPWFAEVGTPLPARIRVACGWPSSRTFSRKRRRRRSECWDEASSADGTAEIFVSPALDESLEVAAVLCHELCHAAIGRGHDAAFVALTGRLGLVGEPAETVAGPDLAARIAALCAGLPPYPHARLDPGDDGEKRGTWLIKVVCPSCGYVVRATRKWLRAGLPTCPCGRRMAEMLPRPESNPTGNLGPTALKAEGEWIAADVVTGARPRESSNTEEAQP